MRTAWIIATGEWVMSPINDNLLKIMKSLLHVVVLANLTSSPTNNVYQPRLCQGYVLLLIGLAIGFVMN